MNFPYINGVAFKEISNYVVDTDVPRIDFSHIQHKDIVWCKTEYIEDLFSYLTKVDKQIILITHCSDHDINEQRFSKKPPNVIKWFAQNVNFKHTDLIPLPIGVENHIGPHKGGRIDASYLAAESFINRPLINKIITPLYCNFTFTNTSRIKTLEILRRKNIAHIDGLKPFSDYCEKMKEFLFVASPPGNGIDCHRTWEALYCGCVPIVQKHFMYDSYQGLPILQIENWEDVDLTKYEDIIKRYKDNTLFAGSYMLDKSFFFDKIINERKKI